MGSLQLNMKEITFRPLRRMKKTGKVITPAYLTWNRVSTANYHEFKLIVDTEYREIPDSEFVFNHKGQQLFFWDYDPNRIPIYHYKDKHDYNEIRKNNIAIGIDWGHSISYAGKGIDTNGTPTFSHYPIDYISEPSFMIPLSEFEPLTAGMVKKWYLWFLLKLEKASISTKHQ